MSLVVALHIFRMIALVFVLVTLKLCPGEGLCLLSFGLFVLEGVVLQGFTLLYSYQCPLLKGQSPKQLTNQQTSAIPVNPNNPSGVSIPRITL